MSANVEDVSLEAIRGRHAALSAHMVRTPLVRLHAPLLDRLLGGGQLYLKLECFQHTGTFKARGALSVASNIPSNLAARGLTGASAGNHAIAIGWAARQLGISAKVVMQSTANPLRISRARAENAEVIIREAGAAVFAEAERLRDEEGRALIHPFEGIDTTLGAAGVGLEILEDCSDIEAIVVSVGGGGLISGIASAARQINSRCMVYGVEPSGADAVRQGLLTGSAVRLQKVDTIADSLAPPMSLPFSLSVIARYVEKVVTLDDDSICAGMVAMQELGRLAVEPAAGAALAAALGPLRTRIQGKKTAVVVCGSNIDAATYASLHERGRGAAPSLLK